MASPRFRLSCAVEGCDGRVKYNIGGTRYCGMHGRRVRNNGSPDVVKRTASYSGAECSIGGCSERPRRNGMCEWHSQQFRTHGDALKSSGMAARGEGSIRKDGYRAVTAHGHPLADRWGHVLEHRMVLFDKIGPGEHPCHWCGAPVEWGGLSLTADHVNFDRSDNDPANLVPACNPCNVRRNLDRRWEAPASAPMTCTGCGHGWQTRAEPGNWIRCPACRAQNKVAA